MALGCVLRREAYKNCIGAMNSLHPLPEPDTFVGYYVACDSVSGAAKITVKKTVQ